MMKTPQKNRKYAFLMNLDSCREPRRDKTYFIFYGAICACVGVGLLLAWLAWDAKPDAGPRVRLAGSSWGGSSFSANSGAEPSEASPETRGHAPVLETGPGKALDPGFDCSGLWGGFVEEAVSTMVAYAELSEEQKDFNSEASAKRASGHIMEEAAYLTTCSRPTPNNIKAALQVESAASLVWSSVSSKGKPLMVKVLGDTIVDDLGTLDYNGVFVDPMMPGDALQRKALIERQATAEEEVVLRLKISKNLPSLETAMAEPWHAAMNSASSGPLENTGANPFQ